MTSTNNETAVKSNVNSGSYLKIPSNKELPKGYKIISEGTASILYGEEGEAFYNKVQIMNRDLSILMLKTFNQIRQEEYLQIRDKKMKASNTHTSIDSQKENSEQVRGLKILEALSATGLRSIRYWKEIENLEQIIANDLSIEAVDCIKRNLKFNEISEEKVVPNCQDAIELMYMSKAPEKQFDIVDLDPYGSAAMFFDSAIQSVKDGGLLCVTCTDLAVLAGSNSSACYARYGSFPAKISGIHEMALRILLNSISTVANRYKRIIVPVVSCYINFYVRVFFRVYTSPKEVNNSHSKVGNLIHCSNCNNFNIQPLSKVNTAKESVLVSNKECDQCGFNNKIAGPFWIAPIHDPTIVGKALKYLEENQSQFTMHKEIKALLTVCEDEIPGSPFFFNHGDVASNFKMSTPPFHDIKSALLNAGYKISNTHCDPAGLKTNAPSDVVFDVYRTWFLSALEKKKQSKETTPSTSENKSTKKVGDNSKSLAEKLLSKKPSIKADFTLRPEAIRHDPLFYHNPEENWGPKKAARITKKRDENEPTTNQSESSASNQNDVDSTSPEHKKRRTE